MTSTFIWHDLMTTDVKAAEEFYSKVVGWRCQDSGMPGQSYTLADERRCFGRRHHGDPG